MVNLRYIWRPFLKYGQMIKLEENTTIYYQGEVGKGFYYLDKGSVKITLLTEKGAERTVNYVPEGMLLGENGINKEPYLTMAVTTAPSVLYYFTNKATLKIYEEEPKAVILFTNSLLYKFRLLAEIITFLNLPVEQQMAHYLLKLVKENEEFPFNQTSFARYVGTSRITVNKIIQKWSKEKLIELSNQNIYIKNISKLKEIRDQNSKNIGDLDMLMLPLM
ncbi:Crp/Fnr family transcriptional regulator [Priestia aryabhattai]|uniref:Crp/Fnr family transcriptional regulator n=1 Tax=Priestia aryabhattai TaxID=412384 RepID=UPI001C8DA9B0|nr:Crp/Fnr family transcriptional regulator [Priestia aryabhattai]MBY0001989.1 Crp/Fnr family transcriptional regulator [Priestia aryabhattai]